VTTNQTSARIVAAGGIAAGIATRTDAMIIATIAGSKIIAAAVAIAVRTTAGTTRIAAGAVLAPRPSLRTRPRSASPAEDVIPIRKVARKHEPGTTSTTSLSSESADLFLARMRPVGP
jgi:hypothetical protein